MKFLRGLLKTVVFVVIFIAFLIIFSVICSILDINHLSINVSGNPRNNSCTDITGFPFATGSGNCSDVGFGCVCPPVPLYYNPSGWENFNLFFPDILALLATIPIFIKINRYWNKKVSQKENGPQNSQPTG